MNKRRIFNFGDVTVLQSEEIVALFNEDQTIGYYQQVTFDVDNKVIVAQSKNGYHIINKCGEIIGQFADAQARNVDNLGFIKVKRLKSANWEYCDFAGRVSSRPTASGMGIYEFDNIVYDLLAHVRYSGSGNAKAKVEGFKKIFEYVDQELFMDQRALAYAVKMCKREMQRDLLTRTPAYTYGEYKNICNELFAILDKAVVEYRNQILTETSTQHIL